MPKIKPLLLTVVAFIVLHNYVNASQKITCESSKTVQFSTQEVIFFESPNYPKNMENECEITFILKNFDHIEIANLMIVLTSGKADIMLDIDGEQRPLDEEHNVIFINVVNFTEFSMKASLNVGYNAFQGMIVADDTKSTCGLQAVTDINPFTFVDDTEMFFMQYPFEYIIYSLPYLYNGRCKWKFVSPKGYKFKFVAVNGVQENNNFELHYGNSEHIFIKSTEETVVYYLEGPLLQIIYTFPPYNVSEFAFQQFYVTLVKKQFIHATAECKVTYDGKLITWELSNGYLNNAKCQLNLTVPYKNEYSTKILKKEIENGVDLLRFYFDNKIINAVDDSYIFQANVNGYNSYVLWEFISDGSVAKEGFSIMFEEFPCKCNTDLIMLSCNDEYYLEFTDPYRDNSYCGNLHCKYNITIDPTCTNKLIFVTIFLNYFIDEYSLSSNGRIVSSAKGIYNNTQHGIFLSPQNENIFELITVPSLHDRYFSVVFKVIDTPLLFKNIILTQENPMYFFEADTLPENAYILIEMDQNLIDKNDTIELFRNMEDLDLVMYFYSDLFNHEVVLPYAKDYRGTFPSFDFNRTTAYVYSSSTTTNPFHTLLFRAKNAYKSGCMFEENVFNSFYIAENNERVGMVAKENETCEIIFINRLLTYLQFRGVGDAKPLYAFTYFWATPYQQNVKITSNSLFKELEFNTTSPWNVIFLTSTFYSVKIQRNSSILIGFEDLKSDVQLGYPFKALWGSPFNGSPASSGIWNVIDYNDFNVPENIFANFKILSFDISDSGHFRFLYLSQYITDFSVNQTFTFTNASVRIEFGEKKRGYNGVLVQIETKLNQ